MRDALSASVARGRARCISRRGRGRSGSLHFGPMIEIVLLALLCTSVAAQSTCTACDLLTLDFENVVLGADNFGNHSFGAASGQPAETRYVAAGRYQGRQIDVVITLTGNRTAHCAYTVGREGRAGYGSVCNGIQQRYWAGFAAYRGEQRAMHGTLTLQDTMTRQPVVVPLWCMTFVGA